MKRILVATALALSSAAGAQTVTDCAPYLGNVRCTTTQQPQVNWNMKPTPNAGDAFNEAFQRGLRERRARELAHQQAQAAQAAAQAAQAQTDALQARQQADELHRTQSLEAAKIVSAGDCAGGQQYALSVGNFTLAQQIKDYCGK